MGTLSEGKLYTYTDYCEWGDEAHYELIDGHVYILPRTPPWQHQDISGTILTQLANFLTGTSCKVFASPFDVRLNADKDDNTVVQPDIVVICDRSKLSGTGCIGAPDMVIEILSPSTASYDMVKKFNLYLQSGVREYWIVDPSTKIVTAHILTNGEYITHPYAATDAAPVHILDGCKINLQEVFAELQ